MLTRSLADIYANQLNPSLGSITARAAQQGLASSPSAPQDAATKLAALIAQGVGKIPVPAQSAPRLTAAPPQPGMMQQQMGAPPQTQMMPAVQQMATAANRITPQAAQAPGMVAQQPGVMQQPIGASNPNQQQLSPQAQALFAELQRRADLAKTQAGQLQLKTQDNGVFSGGQKAPQSAGPPQMSLPQLYAGGR